MKVECVVVGSLEENCYLIKKNNHVIIIDPGDEEDKIIEKIGNYIVDGILVTHEHFDHIGALSKLEELYGVKANLDIENFNYEVILNPGHTLDSKSFYFPEINSVFVGDFIFKDGLGRTDIGGDDTLMLESIRMFLDRFDDVILYPGHGPSTTLNKERDYLEYYLKVSE